MLEAGMDWPDTQQKSSIENRKQKVGRPCRKYYQITQKHRKHQAQENMHSSWEKMKTVSWENF